MDTLQYLLAGFSVALTPENLAVAALGAFIGTVVGMLPGLGPINGVAILMPLAFALKLPPETALILLAAVYMGCEYGGRISSILLNVPGDAGAIMTALDGYPMAQKGMGGVALSISAWSSFVGSVVATVGIVLFAPLLARWALAFGPAEYFALMCFAFACITGLMGDAPLKAALAAVLGLSLSTVGLDSNSGVYRFTGDNLHLSDGIQFIVVVIGVFSISEILLMLEQHYKSEGLIKVTGRALFNFKEMVQTGWGTLRSSVLGFVVGVLPGAGATIASAMAYAMEKRMAGNDGHFGEGDIRGVAAPEAANNASAAGSFVPMLTLGVPGSGTTAVMVGALSLYNITPGPALFSQNPTLVWGLIASLFIANVMLLIINIPMVGVFTRVLRLPQWLLVPGILAVSAIGVFSVHATTFDLLLMTCFGVVGYVLRKQGVPMAPLILGFVLGDMMEQNLRRALSMTNGEMGILIESPISQGLWFSAVLMVLVPPLLRWHAHQKI
ncbi:MAG: tripartite tricarboxylate transporter TctA [Burkholderiales bacterium 35-55-47]|jgi:putative tricarboxylic transport membrane protein|uniref:tripartite tricarboxylate transporter permease n=1 Tax=Limnohabitans sp. TaxID=1907725 RepID=UPI000BC78AFF|nr:tripartite tricarboxylate transporter permease [Limnohabitans sp.]OYY18318.1 MAG: tripartite tricarboxylate transporter TctA [Burkholderiales bacterium 35-55-47]OYZ72731.1 MAG: tripartite tricarboxylate transporter TctA [Burkholderiales bacterium 24-55-52]OZA99154.1 MAG: tripartite tricarboxylate transporter TctA [Burkholderiales bacterium 39-55-53]HQR87098.1 tripartite tricarboxylate transporter permease [Limnohabitans sp.]HQS27854.1 tripartite tricarboxylate transporter permease [Limnohab